MTAATALRIIDAGPSTSIQDTGRRGARRWGVPASGPLDPWAFRIANTAVGNAAGAPAIEVGAGGVTIEPVGGPLTVSVAGGGFDVDVAGERMSPWCVTTLSPGRPLCVRRGAWGSWCVVAIAGHIAASTWLGSSATHVASGLGGGLVASGDTIPVSDGRTEPERDGPLAVDDVARPADVVRVVLGPQTHQFADSAVETLTTSGFRATPAADRMGLRLEGRPLELADALSIPSEPITTGSVQVSGDGVATIQLADHLTIGGYPKLATVIGADLGRVAQLRAGDEIRFRLVQPADAVAAARWWTSALAAAATEAGRSDRTLEQRLRRTDLVGDLASDVEAETQRYEEL